MSNPASPVDARPPQRLTPFLITRQHRRFAEFADAVRRYRYIGACYGAPGIGKTLSARTYAAADDCDQWFNHDQLHGEPLPPSVFAGRTIMWTPDMTTTPRELEQEVGFLAGQVGTGIEQLINPDHTGLRWYDDDRPERVELLIVDEADRLRTTGLEQLRDYFDRRGIALILIGMPGFERRLARYPQLYSRIGFIHQYRPLDPEDIQPVLHHYWRYLGLNLDPRNETDANSVLTIVRITRGNFRLIERLMTQVLRVMDINHLDTITPDVIEAARETLVIGT